METATLHGGGAGQGGCRVSLTVRGRGRYGPTEKGFLCAGEGDGLVCGSGGATELWGSDGDAMVGDGEA